MLRRQQNDGLLSWSHEYGLKIEDSRRINTAREAPPRSEDRHKFYENYAHSPSGCILYWAVA